MNSKLMNESKQIKWRERLWYNNKIKQNKSDGFPKIKFVSLLIFGSWGSLVPFFLKSKDSSL